MGDIDPLYHPELWALDPSMLHLNHGSFGAVPRPVLEEQRLWRGRMEGNPVKFFRRELQGALDEARLALCAFLGADPDGAAFVLNTTSGTNAVFASFPLAAGDEVLITDHIYGAVRFGLTRTAERAAARLVEVPIPLDADDDFVVDALLAAVTERTRLAVVDHISSASVKLFPVERLVPALQERGVAVLVDAAHAPGSLAVDLGALRPDFWTGNFHKWPSAPRGTAMLYVAPRWRGLMRSYPVAWREYEGFPHTFTHTATADQTAWLAAPAAVEFFEDFGWKAVRERNARLVAFGQATVAEAIGADLAGMPDAALPMRLVPLDGFRGSPAEAEALRDRIADLHGIETVINVWSGRPLLRLSAQLYNTGAEYAALGAALRSELEL
jgi:isopenicillin-N epimerase